MSKQLVKHRNYYIIAGMVQHIICNDPILEFFRIYNYPKDSVTSRNIYKSKLGMEFERNINNFLIKKCQRTKIKYANLTGIECTDIQFLMTREALADDYCGLIIQGLISDEDLRIRGCCDIIVRKNLIDILFSSSNEYINPRDYGDWVIIEIKNTKFVIENGEVVTNSFTINSVQAIIYALCIKKMTGRYSDPILLGNELVYDSPHGRNFRVLNNKLIQICDTNLLERIICAIHFLRIFYEAPDIMKLGINLFPNYSNNFDHPYRLMKRKIGLLLGDCVLLEESKERTFPSFDNSTIRSIYDKNLPLHHFNSFQNRIIQFQRSLMPFVDQYSIHQLIRGQRTDVRPIKLPEIGYPPVWYGDCTEYHILHASMKYFPSFRENEHWTKSSLRNIKIVYINNYAIHELADSQECSIVYYYTDFMFNGDTSIMKEFEERYASYVRIDLRYAYIHAGIFLPFLLNYDFVEMAFCAYICGITASEYDSCLSDNVNIVKDICLLYIFLFEYNYIYNEMDYIRTSYVYGHRYKNILYKRKRRNVNVIY